MKTNAGQQCEYCSRTFTDTGQYKKHPSGKGVICRSRAACLHCKVVPVKRTYQRPGWLRWAEGIERWLDALTEPFLDRKAIQAVFRVSRSEAHRIMDDIGGAGALWGTSKVLSRERVLSYVRQKRRGLELRGTDEAERIQKLVAALANAKQETKMKTRTMVISSAIRGQTVEGLPGTIQFSAGHLSIDFHGTEDLLRQLLELVVAIQNDFDRFEQLCERQ